MAARRRKKQPISLISLLDLATMNPGDTAMATSTKSSQSSRSAGVPDEKFHELILYLAHTSESDPKFGSTKLNKLLFFCDFLAFRSLGHSITNQEYQKLPYGPAPRTIKPACQRLVEAGDCVVRNEDHHGYEQKRLIALREADLGLFSSQEIDLVRDVVEELWNSNASEVSELAHQFLGWQAAAEGDTIPYETGLLSAPMPLSEEEDDWARQMVEEYGPNDSASTQV
jgi:hypothetical protein